MSMTHTISSAALCLFFLASNSTLIAKSPGAVNLKPEGIRVPLELVRKNQSLSDRIAKLPTRKSFYLVFKNLHTSKQPGELYHVYLNLEEGKKPTTAQPAVGAINFHSFELRKPSADAFFSFDVTEVLKKFVAAKRLTEPLVVTIIPAEPPAEGVIPTVGQIELVEQ